MDTAGSAYPYALESGQNKQKYTCPACGAAHKFVRYIDTATGKYIADEVGRCDRQESCGYHLKPHEYFAQHPDRAGEYKRLQRNKRPSFVEDYTPPPAPESYTIPAQSVRATYAKEAEAEADRQPAAQRWPFSRILRGPGNKDRRAAWICKSAFLSCPESSTLAAYLFNLFGADTFRAIVQRYYLASWRGAAVFWYIDTARRIRTGKAMYYHDNGHRNKDYNPFYMHPIMSAQAALPEGWTLRRCLFGEHLLPMDPAAPVALVESEKTALIAAAATGGGLWLAAGGLHYLNPTSCAALKGRKVVAYPDLGAFDKWQERLREIADIVGFNVILSDLLERNATPEDRAGQLDIADYLTRELETNTHPQH
ncbi:MAG: hypothetical protein IKX21_06880 [Deltaproteobacteria bacterium]|nr:hypothetical protein [Deltaproteobacteria bacterium]